jgi:hypothetical protein
MRFTKMRTPTVDDGWLGTSLDGRPSPGVASCRLPNLASRGTRSHSSAAAPHQISGCTLSLFVAMLARPRQDLIEQPENSMCIEFGNSTRIIEYAVSYLTALEILKCCKNTELHLISCRR